MEIFVSLHVYGVYSHMYNECECTCTCPCEFHSLPEGQRAGRWQLFPVLPTVESAPLTAESPGQY